MWIDSRYISRDRHERFALRRRRGRETEVPGMISAWVLYFAIMFFGMVFRDFIVLWVLGTLLFVVWRKLKLKKPAKHDYGFDVEETVREWNT